MSRLRIKFRDTRLAPSVETPAPATEYHPIFTLVAHTGHVTHLFAIGGGDMATGETQALDNAILAATDVETPEVLFLPTASGDDPEYIDDFEQQYGERLGCETTVVRLAAGAGGDAVRDRLESADAVYVGGGATGFMLDTWRTRGIDEQLRDAWKNGTIMAGLSAGALCWFAGGLSDAIPLEDISYGPVEGLGFVPDVHATVHATPARRAEFCTYLDRRGAVGIALEDNAALEVRGDEWRVRTATPSAFAFVIYSGEDETRVEPLPADGTYRPLTQFRTRD